MKSPTPEQIKEARLMCGLTQKQAAEMIHASWITWQRYESTGKHSCVMPLASWELFLIKTGLKPLTNISD